jgi:hypothetical protein
VSTDSWTQYAEYARRLDYVRAQEQARTEGMRASVAEMSTHADDLQARLNGQGGMMMNLAGLLRVRRPKLTPIPPEGEVDPATDLARAAATLDHGDLESKQASDRGFHAAMLPGQSALTRSLVVYGVAAFLVLLLQGLAFQRHGQEASWLKVMIVYPLIGFVLGFIVLQFGSRIRIAQPPEPVGRPRAGRKPPKPDGPRTRLGFLLCFLVGPVAGLLIVMATFLRSS